MNEVCTKRMPDDDGVEDDDDDDDEEDDDDEADDGVANDADGVADKDGVNVE